MQWFNKERTKTMLTFPVETVALLSEDNDIKDKEWKNFVAEMYSKGHSCVMKSVRMCSLSLMV